MAVNIGPKIGIDGEAQYRAELNNIIQQAKTLDAEMRAVASSFDDEAKSQESAAKAAELQAKQIEVQQDRVNKLAEMVEKSTEKTGENSTATLKWKEALANAQTDLNNMQGTLGETNSEMSTFQKIAATAGSGLKSGLVAGAKAAATALAATAAAAGALIGKTVELVGKTAEYGDEIDKESKKLGISSTAYQEWDAILQHSGSSIDALKAPMKNLVNLAAEGSDKFEALGLSQEEVASMNQEELFAATISALQNMEEGTEKAALAQDLLGRSAQELAPLLSTSAEETEKMRQNVHDLGGVMSEEAVAASAAYQDSLQDMQTAFSGLQNNLLSEFMPGITTVMDGLTKIFSGDSEGGIQMISDGVNDVLDTITEGLPGFLDAGTEILMAIVQAIIDNLPKLLESAGEIIGKLIAGLLEALPDLIMMAPDIVMAIIKGLVSAWPSIRDAGIDLVTQIGEGLGGAVDNALQWGKDLIDNFIDGILGKAGELWDAVKGIAGGIVDFLGFSEPDKGPLSKFHTFAPDMMQLYAKGITDSAYIAEDAMRQAATGISDAMAGANPTTYNYGGVNLVVNQQPGESADDLVDRIMEAMQMAVDNKKAALA